MDEDDQEYYADEESNDDAFLEHLERQEHLLSELIMELKRLIALLSSNSSRVPTTTSSQAGRF